jgi:hypothetical protein
MAHRNEWSCGIEGGGWLDDAALVVEPSAVQQAFLAKREAKARVMVAEGLREIVRTEVERAGDLNDMIERFTFVIPRVGITCKIPGG